MARRAEATLWMLVKIGKRSVMKRVVKKGRSYVPRVKCPYKPGSYYLRYTQNGSRAWKPVGNDLTLALQEQKARQETLRASTEPVVPPVPPRKTLRKHISQFAAKKDGLTKTERRRANACRSFLNDFSKWWGQEHIDGFQRERFDVFRKHLAAKGKKPRTQNC